MPEVTTPVQIKFADAESGMELGPEAIKACRADAIRSLTAWQENVEEMFAALEQLDGPYARAQLEDLRRALSGAERAVDALWWFAPELGDGDDDA
jgi:hypothetical protein